MGVSLWTVSSKLESHTLNMVTVPLITHRFDGVVAELQEQGLIVTVHSAGNETWFVKDDGIYLGYVVSGLEMLELKSRNQLDIHGIRSLG
jgi:hypothetical protein